MNWVGVSDEVKRLISVAALVAAIVAIIFGVDYYRHRYVRQNSDLVRLLPPGDLNLIYVDVGLLRRADLLGLLANIKFAPDKEYDAFISQTGFDYARDLDAAAIAVDPTQIFILGRGRFHWDKLRSFALSHQGSCGGDACRVRTSTPGRWVNFLLIQPDVLAAAIAPTPAAADILRPPGRRVQEEIPNAPVWARISHTLLANPAPMPLVLQIFDVSIQSAESVTLSAHKDDINLKAHFPNWATADTARQQLELQTRKLRAALAQENEKPDPASISGLLTAGSFQVLGNDVQGNWPIRPELLKALQ